MKLIRSVLTYACETWTLSLGDLTNAIGPIPYYTPNELRHISASLTCRQVASCQTRLDQTLYSFPMSSSQPLHTKILITTRTQRCTMSRPPPHFYRSLTFPYISRLSHKHFFHQNFLQNNLRWGQEQWARRFALQGSGVEYNIWQTTEPRATSSASMGLHCVAFLYKVSELSMCTCARKMVH